MQKTVVLSVSVVLLNVILSAVDSVVCISQNDHISRRVPCVPLNNKGCRMSCIYKMQQDCTVYKFLVFLSAGDLLLLPVWSMSDPSPGGCVWSKLINICVAVGKKYTKRLWGSVLNDSLGFTYRDVMLANIYNNIIQELTFLNVVLHRRNQTDTSVAGRNALVVFKNTYLSHLS